MGVRDSSVTLNLSQDELLITKTIAQADTLQLTQLARSSATEAKKQG